MYFVSTMLCSKEWAFDETVNTRGKYNVYIVRCAGLSWSLSLIEQPYLSGVWLNVNVKTDTRKTCV